MIKNEKEAERFLAFCLKEEITSGIENERTPINIYNEKKLHRILKALFFFDKVLL